MKDKETRVKKENQKGITLIALVVTIVVLIILAVISINAVFSENGIIKQAQRAADMQANATKAEEEQMNKIVEQLSQGNSGTENTEKIPDILERYILGENKTGILATDIFNTNTLKFIDNDIISDASTSVTFLDMDNDAEHIYVIFRYGNVTYIAVGNITTYQTQELRKYEVKKIYEGTVEITGATDLTNVEGTITPAKQYKLNLTINGEEKILYTQSGVILGGAAPFVVIGDNGFIVLSDNGWIGIWGDYWEDNSNNVVLNSIYEVGLSGNYIEDDDGFGVLYDENENRWELCKTPSGNYQIPNYVRNHIVGAIAMDAITGSPIFSFSITLIQWNDPRCPSSIKVTTPDIDFLFTGSWDASDLRELDLSECGDDITIPTDFIDRYPNTTIYVNSVVKANYEAYSNVVAK